MESVTIITRDVNGKRNTHYLRWDSVCKYVENNKEHLVDDEILMISVDGQCVYSGLWTVDLLTWEEVTGFFG